MWGVRGCGALEAEEEDAAVVTTVENRAHDDMAAAPARRRQRLPSLRQDVALAPARWGRRGMRSCRAAGS
jgi:hypothetical protein